MTSTSVPYNTAVRNIFSRIKIFLYFLSSPIRTPMIDNEIVLMNTLYQERFPKATQQMEEKVNSKYFFYNTIKHFSFHCQI